MEEIDILKYPDDFNGVLDTAYAYLVLAEYKLYEWHINARIEEYVSHLEYSQTGFFIDDMKYTVSKKENYIYILKFRDRFNGYVIFNKTNFSESTIYIGQLFVNSEARNMGFSKLLLNKVEEVAKEMRIKKITLDVAKVNPIAIRSYESMGYIRDPNQIPIDWAYSYTKELGGK